MNPAYPLVAERAGHRCEYCHAPEAIFNVPFEVDHIVPLAKGGVDEAANWALACRACNLRKSDAVEGEDPLTSQRVPLFKPREQLWGEHFTARNEPPFHLEGKTPIGRATIERLQLNAPIQLVARAQCVTLRLFS
jgi:hypothetical protein